MQFHDIKIKHKPDPSKPGGVEGGFEFHFALKDGGDQYALKGRYIGLGRWSSFSRVVLSEPGVSGGKPLKYTLPSSMVESTDIKIYDDDTAEDLSISYGFESDRVRGTKNFTFEHMVLYNVVPWVMLFNQLRAPLRASMRETRKILNADEG